ncbi:MAG: hypothetical protein ABWJ97_01090, partial [Thermoproteus sp.]
RPMPWPPTSSAGACKVVPVYFPSPYPGGSFVLMVPPSVLNALGFTSKNVGSLYIFAEGSWQGLQYATGIYGELWTNIKESPGWFAYRGTLLALCRSGTGGISMSQLFSSSYVKPSMLGTGQSDYYDIQYYYYKINTGLSQYPYGLAVLINVTSPSIVWLSNDSAPPTPVGGCVWPTPNGGLAVYNVLKLFEFPYQPNWWNQYGGFCYQQFVWQQYGSGSPVYFIFGVTPDSANVHIATLSNTGTLNDYSAWWFNGWPNTAFNPVVISGGPGYNGPFHNFQYIGADRQFYAIVMPYMWPLPYFIVNGRQYTTI